MITLNTILYEGNFDEFYGKICNLLTEDIWAPWMIERLECYIFNPKYKTKL